MFNRSDIDIDKRISVKFKNAKVKKILNAIFKNMPISFEVLDKQIILKTTTHHENDLNNLEELQTNISGTITDENGMPLPGASILEKNTF